MEVYFYDNGGVCGSRDVTMTPQGCVFNNKTTQPNGTYSEIWIENLTFSIPTATPVDITVNYRYYIIEYSDFFGGANQFWVNGTTVILAGTTGTTFSLACYTESYEDFGSGGFALETTEIDEYELLPQPTIPDVCLVPSGVTCTIGITGYTVTNPVVRGDATGTIEVCITGATGNTSWRLNGNLFVSGYTGSCYTFTGLTAGAYTASITDITGCTAQETYTVLDGEFRTGDFFVNAPTGLTAVENPIVIGVATATNNPNPTSSITTITISDVLNDADNVKFNITSPFEYSNTFYSKAFPNKPNYFLSSLLRNQSGVAVGTNSLVEIATSLAEALQNDALIPKIYFVNNSGATVTLEAKETGTRFNLDSSNVITSTTGITITQTQIGTDFCDGQITDNYSISCEVLVNTNITNQYPDVGVLGDYNRIAELTLPFSPDNRHRFDISGILKSQVDTPLPDINLTGTTWLPSPIQPYYVKLSELYPLIANTNTIKKRYKTTTTPAWVINSSLDRYVRNDMSVHVTKPVEFLTNSPSPKQIQRNSNEFLYFIIEKDYGKDLICKGDLYFYDGSSVTGQTFFTISTGATNAGGVMIMNLSYDKLGLGAFEVSGTTNRKIKRAEIAVYESELSGDTRYSEIKQYRFEIDEMPRKYGVLFQNALGMYDSFDFVGVVEDTIKREFDTYTIPINYVIGGALRSGEKNTATFNTKVTKLVIVNTGWIDTAHFDWLMEILKSNNIYTTNTDYTNFLNLTGFSYRKSSLDDLFDAEFTFEWTIYENNVGV